MISLRTFSYPQDYDRVLDLWNTAGPGVHVGRSDSPEEIVKKLQRDPDLFLLAEEDGQLVGTVLGGFDGRRGIVYHLAVADVFRKRGIGSLLMDELERRFVERGCIRSYLLVTPDNLEAQQFYERRGWDKMHIQVYGKNLGA